MSWISAKIFPGAIRLGLTFLGPVLVRDTKKPIIIIIIIISAMIFPGAIRLGLPSLGPVQVRRTKKPIINLIISGKIFPGAILLGLLELETRRNPLLSL